MYFILDKSGENWVLFVSRCQILIELVKRRGFDVENECICDDETERGGGGWKVLLHGLKRAVCDIPRKFVLRISLYNIHPLVINLTISPETYK
jgi:hypothetical protein